MVKSQSNFSVQVHPLVILNMQDHGIRARYTEPNRTRVLGVVLGKREGKVLELINTIEILYNVTDKKLVIDKDFLVGRLKAYKTMYPTLDCVGWYSTGKAHAKVDIPFIDDMQVQQAIVAHCESPIYLIMNPESEDARNRRSVPIFLYDTNQATKSFERLDFLLAKSEDERIVIDETAKTVDRSGQTSTVSTTLISNMNAIKLLRKKIKAIVSIFNNAKEVREKPEFVRRLQQICAEVASLDKALEAGSADLAANQGGDVDSLNMLAVATKGLLSLQQMHNEFNVVQSSGLGGGARGRGGPGGPGGLHMRENFKANV